LGYVRHPHSLPAPSQTHEAGRLVAAD
jgi:hypothetical protein